MTEQHLSTKIGIDAEELAGQRFPYQEDISLLDDVDLDALTPGEDLNWLEDITCSKRTACPAVFDRYSNSFLKIYFADPRGPRGRDRAEAADEAPRRRATPTASR